MKEVMMRRKLELIIVIPVYNDWEVVGVLLQQIDRVCAQNDLTPRVVIVNDGSSQPVPNDFPSWRPEALLGIEVLNLFKNLGHQRAICVGLVHVSQESPDAAVLVMDADGEDAPEQIPLLVKTYLDREEREAVFAARKRRMEGIIFKLFYQTYRMLHVWLVGADIRIGNFSVLPPSLAQRLVRSSDLWNHYAASVIKSKLPMTMVPIDRARRLRGQSKMNFVGLVLHGLSAMSVYSDIIGVRILMLTSVLLGMGLATMLTVVILRLSTSWAIPGLASTIVGLILVLMFQVVIVSLLFTFGILASRGAQAFIPVRDCPHFVMGVRRLEGKNAFNSPAGVKA